MDATFVRHRVFAVTEALPQHYDCERRRRYCPLLMEGWQSKAAFVIQLREGTDVEAGKVEGRIEHIASYRSARFQSPDEMFAFIARVLNEIREASGGQS